MRAIIKTHNALNGIAGSTEGVHTSAAERAYLQNADAANGVVLLDSSGNLVGPISVRNETEADTNDTTLLAGEIAWTSDTDQIRLGDGVTEGGVAGNMASSTTILCPSIGTPVENAARLRAVYTAAKSYTPGGSALSATNRAVIMLGAGTYDFALGDVADDNHGLELDTQFIDLAGITGLPADVILTSAITIASRGTVEQTADDVRLSGFTMAITSASSTGANGTISSAYFPSTALSNTELANIICSATSNTRSMRTYIEYAGTYTNITGGGKSLGYAGEFSGTCVGGVCDVDSYSTAGVISGTIRDSSGEGRSFAKDGTVSGTISGCWGGYRSWESTTFTATAYIYDNLVADGSGVYAYLPENAKRLNGSDSDSGTGADMTSTYSIAWTNSSGYDLQVSSTLALSNLNTDAETFSVEITSASGANTFTSTKPSGDATWTINIPQYLGSVADTTDYEIDIITDNASNTSVNWTLSVVEQAVL